jgi:alpha-tubulin suppressor-like RCC1 family protein
VLKSDGSVWAWGYNGYGQLGEAVSVFSEMHPLQVGSVASATAIASGHNHIAALKSDGTVLVWGWNSFGQLGDGTITDSPVAVQVPGLSVVTLIACGYEHTAALKSNGTVWAWGRYDYIVGHEATTNNRHSPVQISGLAGVTKIASGYGQLFAIKSDGSVWAWGSNLTGELGDGTTTDRSVPVQVLGVSGVGHLAGVSDIAGCGSHTLALKTDGTVLSWGFNYYGELGIGSTSPSFVAYPNQVPGLAGVVALATSGSASHSLVLKSDGTVWAWGHNANGQLGIGTTTDSASPVQVKGPGGTGFLDGVVAIAAGDGHSLAVKSDGSVWAWGNNDIYQLGDGTYTDSSTPVQVLK